MIETLILIAGDELDKKIALEIFDHRVTDDYRQYGENYFVSEKAAQQFFLEHVFEEPPVVLPKYSTDIKAAWEVVEVMQCKGYSFSIRREGNYFNTDGIHEAIFGGYQDNYVMAETAPLAICLAALKAEKR